MCNVCGVIGISKIDFSNFSSTERVKENKNEMKNKFKPPMLVKQSFLKQI